MIALSRQAHQMWDRVGRQVCSRWGPPGLLGWIHECLTPASGKQNGKGGHRRVTRGDAAEPSLAAGALNLLRELSATLCKSLTREAPVGVVLGVALLAPCLLLAEPSILLDSDPARAIFKVVGWEDLRTIEAAAETFQPDDWRGLFVVFVDNDSPRTEPLPLLGSYRIEAGAVIFEPRYPLQPGVEYRALFTPENHVAESRGTSGLFKIPKRNTTPSTVVVNIYPSADRLPENQLKFYIHFSSPMSRGEAYQRLKLLDGDGEAIELAFLEICEELWDAAGQRLTLLFDPGRVKRDLLPNREAGAPLEAGKSYTLAVDGGWPDAAGVPLKAGFEKNFRVGPADHEPPDTGLWTLRPPAGSAHDPFVVEFPESLDHALLRRVLTVATPAGEPVEGSVEVGLEEKSWVFTPADPWKIGDHLLIVETILEDLAGNMIGRPFEVDSFERVERSVTRETVQLRFRVGGP